VQPDNGRSADVLGFEFALQQQLRFLPVPFDGLGIYANYTYTDSEGVLPEGREAKLLGQADHTLNAALSYERAGFSGQLSFNFVDEYVDERKDPVRATKAALDYLEWLHGRFGSWYLAAAAYNAGPSRVQAILGRHADGRTGDEDLYWEVLDHLPRETREYVPRLVAATILAERASEFGFAASRAEPYTFDRVFVPGGTELSRIARATGLHPSVLRDLNPHLVRGVTPPGEIYGVRVPVGASRQVVAALGAQPRWFGTADE